eukprot:scaffold184789_cov37-Prasinocladus_malaysianus.AAC.1
MSGGSVLKSHAWHDATSSLSTTSLSTRWLHSHMHHPHNCTCHLVNVASADGGTLSWLGIELRDDCMALLVCFQNKASWDVSDEMPPVAYVAEELVKVPKEQTWSDAHGSEGVRHPYAYLLFLGQDGEGNMLPVTSLRERYRQERKDVYAPGQPREEDYDEIDSGKDGKKDDGDEGGGGPKPDEPNEK